MLGSPSPYLLRPNSPSLPLSLLSTHYPSHSLPPPLLPSPFPSLPLSFLSTHSPSPSLPLSFLSTHSPSSSLPLLSCVLFPSPISPTSLKMSPVSSALHLSHSLSPLSPF